MQGESDQANRATAAVRLHPHALDRLGERGITQDEVIATVRGGSQFAARFARAGFRRNFAFNAAWRGRMYAVKQVEAYAIEEPDGWLVITVIAKYF